MIKPEPKGRQTVVGEWGFTGPLVSDRPNPRAYGNICRQVRRGDYVRSININGNHKEYGQWRYSPKEE